MDAPYKTEPVDEAEILSQQAAGLLAGVDRTAELLSAAAGPQQAELAGLMRLAGRLQAAMPPVAPRPGFAAELRARLDLAAPAAGATRLREREQRRRWLAGIGGAVALLGLGLVTYRTAQAVGGRVAGRVPPADKAPRPPAPAGLGPEPLQL